MQPQTPGVYINEINAFPNSVVEVATAVPVFIGYTAIANYNGEDLAKKPRRVTSLKEFETYFGQGAVPVFDLKERAAITDDLRAALAVEPLALQIHDVAVYGPGPGATALKNYSLVPDDRSVMYYLYNSVRLFYQNGGATCYIISIGQYANDGSGDASTESLSPDGDRGTVKNALGNVADQPAAPSAATPTKDQFMEAIDSLMYEQEPTMLLCPDALCLSEDDYYAVSQKMLQHCNETQSRVAVLDVYKGAVTDPLVLNGDDTPVSRFREKVSNQYLKYGVSYFPWVHTTVVGDTETTFQNMSRALVAAVNAAAAKALATAQATALAKKNSPELPAAQQTLRSALAYAKLVASARRLHLPSQEDVQHEDAERIAQGRNTAAVQTAAQTAKDTAGKAASAVAGLSGQPLTPAEKQTEVMRLHSALLASNLDYARLIDNITRYRNTLPVAPAMAGVYTAVDSNRGVWKAPANVGLSGVMAPTVNLSDNDQARLTVDAVSGKSINAIRPFPGQGVLVWGGRTLDGNSQDWRFVNVRRTMIMLEQSIKLAARAYVFEPNDANTWVTVQSMISNFLFNLWKQGALAGSKPDDAYSVAVGLGSTMTGQDILDGYLNVFVKVAISRPAEFLVLSFQQQMQKS